MFEEKEERRQENDEVSGSETVVRHARGSVLKSERERSRIRRVGKWRWRVLAKEKQCGADRSLEGVRGEERWCLGARREPEVSNSSSWESDLLLNCRISSTE